MASEEKRVQENIFLNYHEKDLEITEGLEEHVVSEEATYLFIDKFIELKDSKVKVSREVHEDPTREPYQKYCRGYVREI